MTQKMTTADGSNWIREPGGRWRSATPDENAIMNRSTIGVAMDSAVGLLKQAKALGETVVAGQTAAPIPVGGPTLLAQQPQTPDAAGRQQALTELSGLAEQGALRQELRPGGVALGEMGLEAALGFAGVPASLARRTATTAARRSVRSVAGETAERAVMPNDDRVERLGAAVNDLGGRSVGAAQGTLWQNLERMPVFRSMLDGLSDFVGVQRRLTGTQQRMVDEGLPGQYGIELLPGQANGNGIIAEVVRRDPLMADALDDVLSRNSERVLSVVSRSVALDPGDWGRDIRELGRQRVGQMFDDVESEIGEVLVPDDMAPRLSRLLTPTERSTLELGEEAVNVRLAGSDAMDVRRYIADELASMNQSSSPQLATEVRAMEQLLDEYDELLEASVSDPQTLELWREARSRWRVVRALDRQGSITADGDISVKTLVNNLEREFEREFRRRTLARGEGLPPDVVEMLNTVRVARTFMSNLNDSGTATGNALMQAFSNPSQWAKKRIAAKFIRDVILNDPYGSAAMVQ